MTTGPFYAIFSSTEQRTQAYEQIAENNARNAAFAVTFTTTGDGEAVMTTPLIFDTVFTERPTVSGAPVILRAPDPKLFGLPRVNCGVYRWITEKSPAGPLYTGCYPYFVVDVPLLPGAPEGSFTIAPNCVIEHHLRFDGISLKKLPDEIVDMTDIEVPDE